MKLKNLNKLKYKKYLYLINDVTGLLLQKEREQLSEEARKLRIALIVAGVILFLSVVLNICLIFLK